MTHPSLAPTRAEQRAREAAENAEFNALLARLRVLWPNFGCFCGSLDDLRRTVADLDRTAHHHSHRDPSTPQPTAARSAHHQTGSLHASTLAAPLALPDAEPDTPADTRPRVWDTHARQPGLAREADDPDWSRAAVAGPEPDPMLQARLAGIRARHALDPGVGDDEELRRGQLIQWHADDTSRRAELTADLIDTTVDGPTVDGPCGGDPRSNSERAWSQ